MGTTYQTAFLLQKQSSVFEKVLKINIIILNTLEISENIFIIFYYSKLITHEFNDNYVLLNVKC
jgi:hypothetical protein